MTTPQKKLLSRKLSNEPSSTDEQQQNLLKLDKARDRMATLQLALDSHSSDVRERVMKRKADHAKALNEEKENQSRIKEEIENLKKKEFDVVRDIERERQEVQEMKDQISNYMREMRSHSTNRDGLIAEIEEYRERINKHKDMIESEKKTLDGQAAKNAPELAFFEQKLGLKLRSNKLDCIFLAFSQIDDRQPDRQFSIELDLSEPEYKVVSCNPRPDELDLLLHELNSSRGFYTFIKRIRGAFRGVVVKEKHA
ncbi:hypothetical protein E3P92_03656 [Wallemia ichthyophaga]|uniref:Kinetochore protein SPC25 n=1 Tax=Wallemia ichthyophaga TaxID=245174 RepID=A0A4T0H3P1_WALIC|nr:hypothetical protein E3P93_03647 [Wallemia ichthyophaga]TIB08507.1 hypothetical protein E3P90_03662 [Wallemia ichthyophaga]TIB08834.1 hypothetical protein E3P92_03656 [Wallemia ichthyophaga]TIB19835.1 hypothetical protein E3P89_03615 [Wallemia ichthyophaga]TIB21099.1 hypothetical protein E3P88_03658 [Wallemia ichthyophaga]